MTNILLVLNLLALVTFSVILYFRLPHAIKALWNNELAATIDRLTSVDTIAAALAEMDSEQQAALADAVYEKRRVQ